MGEGKNLLLLHGYGASKESFYYQIEFLSKYYCVTALDFPCFGASEQTDFAFSVGDYADWLAKFINKLNLDRPHVLAHSFGARVAIKLLSEFGCLADGLVITGGAGLVKPRSSKYMRKVRTYRLVKKLFPKFAERHFGSKEYRELSPMMKESYKKIVNEDLREAAQKITNPTYLLYGREDSVTPPDEEGKIFNCLIAGSKLEIMDGGHFCFCEHPQQFNEKILTFLGEL